MENFFCLGFSGDFVLPTEILSLRRRLSVFLSRRKKNSEKERPLRGLRREVRFIMSPPGKRRHNELNAAPPPETPRGTGKPGETNNRDVVHSGESFRVRGKTCLFCEPRGMIPPLPSPQRGSQGQFAAERSTVRVPMLSGSLCLPVGHFQTFMPPEKCTITGLK